MSKDFNYWKNQHDSNELKEFNNDDLGSLWLKVKSIVRRGIIDQFIAKESINLSSSGLNDQFKELFTKLSVDSTNSHSILNNFIYEKNASVLENLVIDNLVNELYKVDNFKWGADNQNDLGKYLVKKYVKDNNSYDFLIGQMENGVMRTVQDYLICSWYNHWSSILIEHIFKTHNIVLPTVGQIKSVDFFMNNIPFDLKVTYLPTNFIEDERRKKGLRPELTALKQSARNVGIRFSNDDSNLYYVLSERLKDNASQEALDCLKNIKNFRIQLLQEVKTNPMYLAKNLYEKQSEFRFGAENRIFLILVDTENFEDSWKLKRNFDLLKPGIHNYLDCFVNKRKQDLKLEFYQEGNSNRFPKKYEVLTDIIVIEKYPALRC